MTGACVGVLVPRYRAAVGSAICERGLRRRAAAAKITLAVVDDIAIRDAAIRHCRLLSLQ
jgi:hypothetical protein